MTLYSLEELYKLIKQLMDYRNALMEELEQALEEKRAGTDGHRQDLERIEDALDTVLDDFIARVKA